SGRTRSVSQPRMLAMWLAREYTRAAFAEIGDYFGQRAHNTVISAHQRVSRWMDDNETIQTPHGNWNARDAVRRVEAELQLA
ncbi:MAG: helix-turn-helix domain-containing protein, partial [Planctomycetota bacterium]|nr:helix-turn-helix domain-containing protein [Planctomycetota bacterium]